MSEISDTLLKQRIRNRFIEAFDDFADIEKVSVLGTTEIIETWYDFMHDGKTDFYDEPVFTQTETAAIVSFHATLESCFDKIPETWKPTEVSDSAEWNTLKLEAKAYLKLFMERGVMDDEKEVF